MDALTSQALVSGYRAALVAAERLPTFFPLLMTAAGTIPPAKVLVLGAGVAGLQAIATAKRLGAVVEAYDVRAASADEVRSMGAKFVELDLEALEGTGGYAREMSEDRAARQRELLAPYVAAADAVITTAAMPGRPAPLLVTRAMVEAMRPGSVVVDLAAESGGNVEGVGRRRGGRDRRRDGLGRRDVPSQMPVRREPALRPQRRRPAAADDAEDGRSCPDWDDEIVAGCLGHRATASRTARGSRDVSDGIGAADGLRARGVRRLRGRLEGVDDAAHAADVRRERDPRRDPGRRDPRDRAAPTAASSSRSACIAVVLATVNMVGGFVVTDRMLEMFRGRKPAPERTPSGALHERPRPGSTSPTWSRRSASSSRSRACRRPRPRAQRQPDRRRSAPVLAVRRRRPRPRTWTTCR